MFNPKFKWLTVAIIAVVFLLDNIAPREWLVSRFYLLSILFTVCWNRRNAPYISAVACTVFTLINLALPPYSASWHSAVLSRATDVLLFWFVAMFVEVTNRSVNQQGKLILDAEQKHAELKIEGELRKSEQRFRELADAIPQIVWTASADGAIDHFNSRAKEYSGMSTDQLKGWSWDQVIHPDDLPKTIEVWTEALKSGRPRDIEFRILRHDGVYRWHMGRQYAGVGDDGRIARWYGTCTDIEEQKQIEAALRRSEQRFSRFMKYVPGHAWIKDLSGQYVFANESWTRAVRGPEESINGLTDEDLVPLPLATKFREDDQIAMNMPGGLKFVKSLELQKGNVQTFLVNKFRIPGRNDDETLIGGIAIDITEQHRAEAAIRAEHERFNVLVATAPGLIFSLRRLKDGSFRFPFIGTVIKSLWRLSPEDLAIDASPLVQVLVEEDFPRVAASIQESARSMSQWREDFRVRHPQRGVIWIEAHAQPILDSDGTILWHGFLTNVTERQQAKIELERRKKELNLILDSIPALIFYKDLNHRFVRINEEFVRRIGIARELVAGKTSAEVGSPYAEHYHRDEDEVIASGLPKRSIIEPVRTDLGTRWLQTDKIPIHDENGKLTGIVGFSLDITDRKLAQEALQESAARIRTIGNHLPEGVLYQIQKWPDGRKRFLDFTEGLEEALGVTAKEILADANNFYSLVILEDADRLDVLERYSMSSLAIFVFEFRVRARNGQIRWLHCRSTPQLQTDGSVISDGIAIDITDRKQIEVVQAREALIMSNVQDSVIVSDLDGIVTDWNEGATRLFGWQADEVLGRMASERWPEEAQSAGRAMIAEIAAGREVIGEIEDYRKDGSRVWIETRVSIFKDSLGRPVGILGVSRDITERKRMEEELKASRQRLEYLSRQLITTQESERRHLARELHDEIGQILTAIKMSLRSTLRTADSVVQSQIEENMAMVDLAIVQVRNLSLSLRPLQLDELGLVAALHWVVKQQAKIAGFQEHLNVDVGDLHVPSELSTVCFRIAQEAVTNAVRHGHPRNVYVTLHADNDELSLKIQDDGVGFDVANANLRASNGTSLGLLSMQERVSLVGGGLSIKSVLGQGTVISARFPLKSP